MSVDLKGADAMIKRLDTLINALPTEIGKALYAEAQIEKTESMRRTPVDEGTLKASHHVTAPETKGGVTSVHIRVGGAAAPYAVYVHEDLEANHTTGQAKFLESTLKESAPHILNRVARRIELRKKVDLGGSK